jgi:hypothetical protein
MKKLLFVAFAIIFVTSVNAQVLKNIARGAGNKVLNSAGNRADKEVDKQIDKGVNKFFDKLIKEDTTKTKENETTGTAPTDTTTGGKEEVPASVNKFMRSLGVSNEAIPHKDVYSFTGQIVMSIDVTDSNGKKAASSDYVTCFNDKTSDAMFKANAQDNSSETSTIIDLENKCMLMLTDSKGKKTGFATKFDPNASNNTNTGDKNAPKIEDECTPAKTGNTKTISGYNCSEYRCEDKESILIVWTTKDLSASNNSIFAQNAMGKKYKTDGFDGMVIQYETHSKTDKSSSITTIKSIDMSKSSSFSTVGYQISGFNLGGVKK